MATLKVHIPIQSLLYFIILRGETYFWTLIQLLQHTLPLFNQILPLKMAIIYSPLHLALPILLLHSYGVSKAPNKITVIKVYQLYSQAASNTSTLMATKMGKTSLECSRQVTGLNSGSYTTLEQIQALHFVFHEALSMVKKSLLLNIKMEASPPSTQELL
jgi:hypothetical protein